MPRGGARPGAGRPVNPNSQRQKKLAEKAKRDAVRGTTSAPAKKSSARAPRSSSTSSVLGHRFGKLPRAGYTGRVPAWPLSMANAAERAAWTRAWRTPQAAAWATEPWRWWTVALWVRSSVRSASGEAPAAIITATLKLADQIGLTPAGLLANGWEIEEAPGTRAAAEPPAPAQPEVVTPAAPPVMPSMSTDPRDRLKIIDGGG